MLSFSYYPAENLIEYKWPPDETGEYYMLQEQVSEYLGVTSFKRKYPGITSWFMEQIKPDFELLVIVFDKLSASGSLSMGCTWYIVHCAADFPFSCHPVFLSALSLRLCLINGLKSTMWKVNFLGKSLRNKSCCGWKQQEFASLPLLPGPSEGGATWGCVWIWDKPSSCSCFELFCFQL